MIISGDVQFAVAFLSTFKEEQNHLDPIWILRESVIYIITMALISHSLFAPIYIYISLLSRSLNRKFSLSQNSLSSHIFVKTHGHIIHKALFE